MTRFQRLAVVLMCFSFIALVAVGTSQVSAEADPFYCSNISAENNCKSSDDGCNTGLDSMFGKCSFKCNSGTLVSCGTKDEQQ